MTFFEAYKDVPYLEMWLGETGSVIINWSIPISLLVAIPVMLGIGLAMERGLIRHFYKRPHADQILVTFGLAIVLQEIIKAFYGANPIPQTAPDFFSGTVNLGALIEMDLTYPTWRLVYFIFSMGIIAAVFSFLQFTTFGMVAVTRWDGRPGNCSAVARYQHYQAVLSTVFGIAAVVSGLAGLMGYPGTPARLYHMGMDFVLFVSVVVVVVGGMGSLPGRSRGGILARYFAVAGLDDRE